MVVDEVVLVVGVVRDVHDRRVAMAVAAVQVVQIAVGKMREAVPHLVAVAHVIGCYSSGDFRFGLLVRSSGRACVLCVWWLASRGMRFSFPWL